MTDRKLPTIIHADCRQAMREMAPNSIDAIVTDPPYGLRFMGEKWDHGVPGVDFWSEALRVAKPGTYMLACGGTRTFHRLGSAIEDGGWEVRDAISWLYSSGFPKSLNVAIAIDKSAGAMSHRGARVSVAGNRLRGGEDIPNARPVLAHEPITDAAKQWQGWGTALKPAWEPIILARKPLVGTVAANVLVHGTGAMNIDSARLDMGEEYDPNAIQRQGASGKGKVGNAFGAGGLVGKEIPIFNPKGRWPANVALDEGAAEILDNDVGRTEFGGPSRFFFTSKASRRERGEGNNHPTVKPLALMRYCVKLLTPPGGTVLDPFAGSGTTLLAAMEEGFNSVGIEREAEYVEVIRTRIERELASVEK